MIDIPYSLIVEATQDPEFNALLLLDLRMPVLTRVLTWRSRFIGISIP